jgi:serine/threonine protein kinase
MFHLPRLGLLTLLLNCLLNCAAWSLDLRHCGRPLEKTETDQQVLSTFNNESRALWRALGFEELFTRPVAQSGPGVAVSSIAALDPAKVPVIVRVPNITGVLEADLVRASDFVRQEFANYRLLTKDRWPSDHSLHVVGLRKSGEAVVADEPHLSIAHGMKIPYLAFEDPQGETPSNYFHSKNFRSESRPYIYSNITDFVEILGMMAEVIGYLHHRNILHFDISPYHGFVIDPRTSTVKITQFHSLQFGNPSGKFPLIATTPSNFFENFAAPEVIARAGNHGREADVYNLAASMEALFNEKILGVGDRRIEVIPGVRQIYRQLRNEFFLRNLSPDPRKRMQSMDEVHEWTKNFLKKLRGEVP